VRGGGITLLPTYILIQLNSNNPPPPLSTLLLAHVSRDGRDLVIMTSRSHVLFIRDFERISHGEASLETSGTVLHLSEQAECFYLAFEHGRVCVATVRTVYPTLLFRVLTSFLFSFIF
jgi:hypothetical protein